MKKSDFVTSGDATLKEQLLEFVKRGTAMTCEELAGVLKISPDSVRRNSKPPEGFIPRIPHLRAVRFDPVKMIEVFCESLPDGPLPAGNGSLTTEKRSFSGNHKGGFRKCL